MYKLSELIGKRTITLPDAQNRGIILGAYFDKSLTKCKCFSVLNEVDDTISFVDFKNFSSLFSDAAVIRSAADLYDSPAGELMESPINLPAYNQDGRALGLIRDIVMEEAEVKSLLTGDEGDGEINAGTLLSRSSNAAVFNDTGKPIKIKTVKKTAEAVGSAAGLKGARRIKNADGFFSADDDSLDEAVEGAAAEGESDGEKAETRIVTPFRAAGGVSPLSKYYFLLGKRLQRSVYTEDGKLIARENDLVSEKIIQRAKEYGKLVAVALHSL